MCSPILISVQDGATALYVAAQNGHLVIVGLLIAAKALIDFAHIAVSIVLSKTLINYLCTEWVDSIACSQSEWSL